MKTITLCLNPINLNALSRKAILFLVISFSLIACSSDDVFIIENASLGVNVRVTNVSDFYFEDIIVNASTNNANVNFNIENLDVGETTDYRNFAEVFPYPWASLVLDGETLVWHGYTTGLDVPYFEGSFTCFIDVIDGHNQEKSLLVF